VFKVVVALPIDIAELKLDCQKGCERPTADARLRSNLPGIR